jgi:N-acetylmuramic acid 6-phosphate etherase
MINKQMNNYKLIKKKKKMVMERTGIKDYDQAKEILLRFGSVKKAVDSFKK